MQRLQGRLPGRAGICDRSSCGAHLGIASSGLTLDPGRSGHFVFCVSLKRAAKTICFEQPRLCSECFLFTSSFSNQFMCSSFLSLVESMSESTAAVAFVFTLRQASDQARDEIARRRQHSNSSVRRVRINRRRWASDVSCKTYLDIYVALSLCSTSAAGGFYHLLQNPAFPFGFF